jgi:hypothetical protein
MRYLRKFKLFENEVQTNVVDKASIANLAELGAESIEDISFKFRSKPGPTLKGVLLHEIITIDVFNTPDKENIQFVPYHLIYGDSSLAIFDAFGVNETAGLTRKGCEEHLSKLEKEGKNETWDGAYIAGLCNWAGPNMYLFINVARVACPGYANRVLSHESLHMARMLITLEANEFIRTNQGKGEWWLDDRAVFTKLDDTNEEYFAEALERINAIAYDRWEKVKGKFELPPKSDSAKPLDATEYKTKNVTLGEESDKK